MIDKLRVDKEKIKVLKIFLHGGEGELLEQLAKITEALEEEENAQSLEDKTVSYVAIALEPLTGEEMPISVGEVEATYSSVIRPFFLSKKIREVVLVTSKNISDIFCHDIVIISGGDTTHLLKVLEEHGVSGTLKAGTHKITSIVGISAGAIALAAKGISKKDGKETLFNGMGLFPGTVIPHVSEYPDYKAQYGESVVGLGKEVMSHSYTISDRYKTQLKE